MPLFHIRHRTHYIYSSLVIDSANQVKLYPINDECQKVSEHRLVVSANPIVHTISDYFGNRTGFFTVLFPHKELSIDSLLEVEMFAKPQPVKTLDPSEVWKQILGEAVQLRYHDFLKAEEAESKQEIQQAIHEILGKVQHPLDTIIDLSDYIYDNFTYTKGVTSIETSVDEIWKLRAGVCQDFAHLLLYMLRLMGVPARYISGYICPGHNAWRGEGATHAWAEVWLPDTGWVGIDPTNKCIAAERHVRLASGRNFSDCTPVKGTYKGATEHKLEVTVQFGAEAFSEKHLDDPLPTFVSGTIQGGAPRNSYMAYLQMQQQQ
ncbi:MAG: transglutaminase family protein [Cyclobacteriaceae bacterium]|nr:transglutaminase family protein [Cyclobacteriaceae bacterium]